VSDMLPVSDMLRVNELSTWFLSSAGWIRAVNSVSFEVPRSRFVGIVGESGCGKSVTLRSILGLVRPPGRVLGGEVLLEGYDLLKLRDADLRRLRGMKVGFVGQSPFAALNPILSIEKQFANVLRAHRRASREEVHELAVARLKSVRIPDPERVLRSHAHELSGGMAQRVIIAIAMLLDPPLLIADEPTTALDVTVQRQILDLIHSLVQERGISVLLVTHDLSVVAQYCDDVVVMYAGKVVERGRVADVFRSPAHPYTQALLQAVPRPGRALVGLSGRVPDLVNYPLGCPYAARCNYVFDRCWAEPPQPRLLMEAREISCHLPQGANGTRGPDGINAGS
jgi:peptide/nickel transport system ATP-binding protein